MKIDTLSIEVTEVELSDGVVKIIFEYVFQTDGTHP